MKKFAKTLAVIILVALASSSLFAANLNETAILRLTAYIPEKTTFSMVENTFIVQSNTYNFTYSIQETARTKMLLVMAT